MTAAVLATLFGASVASAATKSPFVGSWTSTDPVDGSTQHLTVRGGDGLQLAYVDDVATTCVNIGASTNVFSGVLAGHASGNVLSALWRVGGCGPTVVLRAADGFWWTFVYDPNTDTLWGAIDDGPATWYRS